MVKTWLKRESSYLKISLLRYFWLETLLEVELLEFNLINFTTWLLLGLGLDLLLPTSSTNVQSGPRFAEVCLQRYIRGAVFWSTTQKNKVLHNKNLLSSNAEHRGLSIKLCLHILNKILKRTTVFELSEKAKGWLSNTNHTFERYECTYKRINQLIVQQFNVCLWARTNWKMINKHQYFIWGNP